LNENDGKRFWDIPNRDKRRIHDFPEHLFYSYDCGHCLDQDPLRELESSKASLIAVPRLKGESFVALFPNENLNNLSTFDAGLHPRGRAWVANHYYVENVPRKIYHLLNKAESLSENAIVVNQTPRFSDAPPSEFKLATSNAPLSKIGNIELIDLSFNAATFQVYTDKSALFVWADSYYPGWKAAVNHEKVQILQANLALKAVPIRKGWNLVEFSYKPPGLNSGLLLFSTFLILILVLLLRRVRTIRLTN
jgi:hypothetical protein